MKSNKSFVLGSSLLITLVALVCKLLGFIREMSIASVFGTSSHVDAYLVALSIPSLLVAMIAGAIGTVVVPQFIRKNVVDGREAALAMVESVWTILFGFALIVIMFCEALMPFIIHLVAPGFDGAVFDETVYLARILTPAALFFCLLPIARGILNSLQRYLLTATVELVLNIFIIMAIWLWARFYGMPGLALGTLAGMTVQLLILWPALQKYGFHPRIHVNRMMPEMLVILKLALPVMVGSGLSAINLFVDRIMASSLPTGSVAALNYANLIYVMPQVFMAPAIGAVFYTILADMSARNDIQRVITSVKKGLSLLAYFGFPTTAGVYLLATPLVQIIYQRGAFGIEAAEITAAILAMYVLGLPALALRDVCARAYYAGGDTLTPLYTGCIAIGVNIVLILILVNYMLAPGLALATAISNWVAALTLMWAWNRKHIGFFKVTKVLPYGWDFWVELGKILISTLVMAAVVGTTWHKLLCLRLTAALTNVRPGSMVFTWLHLEHLSLAVLLGVIIYLFSSRLLKSENAAFISSEIKQFAIKILKTIQSKQE